VAVEERWWSPPSPAGESEAYGIAISTRLTRALLWSPRPAALSLMSYL
jgi:hypothetical protein